MEAERTPFPSPVQSRSQTPIGRIRRHFELEETDEFAQFLPFSRSQSRARPLKRFSTSERSASRRTRFASEQDPATQKQDSAPRNVLPDHKEISVTGDEFGENAGVWNVYIEEAAKADLVMIDGWNRSMDVLLVFTGLFSAVLTTFIIQSYQNMAPDPAETTNALLKHLILLQFNSSSEEIQVQKILAGGLPTKQVHWVNGLWFAALACSLSTALISMLAKQWLQSYTPVVSGSSRFRARTRHARYIQLEVWHVPAIINALPFMLHIALLLFFAGLIVLLWSEDLAITIATWFIVAVAYIFYFISIWLPLFYPDCPYHHPISDHIRNHIHKKGWTSTRRSKEISWKEAAEKSSKPPTAVQADHLDAEALIWLFTKSTDEHVVSASLQAISGLPRDFSALCLLREAGALRLVKKGFESCFYKDTTIDLQWHLIDHEKAALYCRAWINLTRGTSEQWPFEIVEPLWILQEVTSFPEVAAIASCAVALSSFDSHRSQWELLSLLSKCASGELQLSQATQCCLLDSIIECMVRWEMPSAVIEQTNLRAVPTLLRILNLTEDLPSSELQSASAVALYVITRGPIDLVEYYSESKRKTDFCPLLIQALSVLIASPDRYGVKDDLFDIASRQFCRLSPFVVAQSERFPQHLKKMVRATLSELYVDGKVGAGTISDSLHADVLNLLFPPILVAVDHRPKLVSMLVENIRALTDPDVTSWSVRLLEVLVSNCSEAVLSAFSESNGVSAVLRAANAGGVDSRRLQIESFRTLCTFIRSITSQTKGNDTSVDVHVAAILQSDFFEVLCGFMNSRRWWLYEISGDWMPALVELCKLTPHEPGWPLVIKVFRDFVDRNDGEDGCLQTAAQLDEMAMMTGGKSGAP